MKVITGEPLAMWELISLTGKDACTTIGDYKVRVMNFSEGQEIEVVDTVEWNGYLWGIKAIAKSKPRYDYLAFKVDR